MFGYVTVFKDELKIKDYNIYRAYYCGLCKRLGEKFGTVFRLGLSYDLTFLAIVTDAVCDAKTAFSMQGCAKHLGKKRLVAANSFALNYAADMSIVLFCGKILDDMADERFSKAHFLYLPYKMAARKISSAENEIVEKINENLNRLYSLEKEKCCEPDIVSDAFANALKAVFSIRDGLEGFSYNLGKFIYLIDALDDVEKDIKSNSYNPFIEKYGNDIDKIIENASFLLTFTLSKLAEEFEKLKIYKNYEIIKNTVYLGLRSKLDAVLRKYAQPEDNKKGEEKDEKSV